MRENIILTLLILVPLTLFMSWYSNNTDQSIKQYAKEQYVRCLFNAGQDINYLNYCENLNPNQPR